MCLFRSFDEIQVFVYLVQTIIFGAISGQMYNQIRGPPLLHATPKGEIVGFMFYSDVFSQKAFIYPGSDYQFVAETVIVMILCILFPDKDNSTLLDTSDLETMLTLL